VAPMPAARPLPPAPAPIAAAPAHAARTAATQAGTHVVAPGETLSKISRRYGKSIAEIAKANNIPPHATLKIGDRLVIPGTRTAQAQPIAQPNAKPIAKVAQAKPLGGPAVAPAAAPAATPAPAAKLAPAPKPTAAAKQTQQVVASVDPAQSASVVTPVADAPAAPHTGKTGDASPSFRWPVKGRVIAGYGPKTNGQQNDGINLAVPEGTPVKAAEDGVVAYAGSELKGYGNLVLVRHSNGYVTAYAHAKELMVKRGDTIKRGQVIAKSGQTGNVDTPQLHFEVRKGPSPLDPMPLLSGG
jgi:murein DD-endopeptidase MepM/ murein hydrolase activator NlpD